MEARVVVVLLVFPIVWSAGLLWLISRIRAGRVSPTAGAAWFAGGIAFLPMVPVVSGITAFDPLVLVLIAGPVALLAFFASRRAFIEVASEHRQ